MALLHNVRGALGQAVALLEEVAKLNILVPDVRHLMPTDRRGREKTSCSMSTLITFLNS